jgi:hypothetical protein
MTTVFSQFLRQQAEKFQAEARAGKDTVDEWRAAIEKLFARIRAWLAESDPDAIIQIKERKHEVTEAGLGRYEVPRLDLHALGKWVGIIPKARNTVASARPPLPSAPGEAAGRVDMTDEVQRYVLYRFQREGGEDQWVIDDLRSEQRPLDQRAFEEALMSYLR